MMSSVIRIIAALASLGLFLAAVIVWAAIIEDSRQIDPNRNTRERSVNEHECTLLARYAESLIQVTVAHNSRTPPEIQAVMRKVHGVWKENEFDGRSPEFIEAAKQCLVTAQRILKAEITAEEAAAECAKLRELT